MRATRFVVIPTRAILEEFHIYFKFIQNELISFKWEKKQKQRYNINLRHEIIFSKRDFSTNTIYKFILQSFFQKIF